MKRLSFLFFLLALSFAPASAQQVDYMTLARQYFFQGHLKEARAYALKAQAQGVEEASIMIGQIDYKLLQQGVDNSTATREDFENFQRAHRGTQFAQEAGTLYQQWKGARTAMHFDRAAYEREHFGPMWRVGLSGDIAFGCNANYGGGASLLIGRTNMPVNLLLGLEFNVMSHFDINYDEYNDEYYSDNEPYLRARRLGIPIELQFNLKHNDRRERLYLGFGIDYYRNFYGRLIDPEYHQFIDYDKAIKKHTCDFRLSLGYSWRHIDVFGYMKVLVSNPFDNDLVWWENDGPDQDLDTYHPNIHDQLNRRVAGGFGVRVWL